MGRKARLITFASAHYYPYFDVSIRFALSRHVHTYSKLHPFLSFFRRLVSFLDVFLRVLLFTSPLSLSSHSLVTSFIVILHIIFPLSLLFLLFL